MNNAAIVNEKAYAYAGTVTANLETMKVISCPCEAGSVFVCSFNDDPTQYTIPGAAIVLLTREYGEPDEFCERTFELLKDDARHPEVVPHGTAIDHLEHILLTVCCHNSMSDTFDVLVNGNDERYELPALIMPYLFPRVANMKDTVNKSFLFTQP